MSSNETYELGYDQLLRDIYSKPLLRKPALGKMPSYLEADEPVLLSTAREQQKLKEKIDQSSDLQTWIARYCDKIIESLDQFKVTFNGGKTCDLIELVEKSIASMQVVNNDFIAFVDTVASNSECYRIGWADRLKHRTLLNFKSIITHWITIRIKGIRHPVK